VYTRLPYVFSRLLRFSLTECYGKDDVKQAITAADAWKQYGEDLALNAIQGTHE
jgi:hypothetical protein